MAKLTLTICGIATHLPTGKADVSVSAGDEKAEGYLTMMMPSEQKRVDVDHQIPIPVVNYLRLRLSIQAFSFLQKMYRPDEIVAELLVVPVSPAEGKAWEGNLSSDFLRKLFVNKRVALACGNRDADGKEQVYTVGSDFYVHEVVPCKYPDKTLVTLKIYSPDKLLTLSSYCRSWTARKLSANILHDELPNYKLPYDKDSCVNSDTTRMKHLLKGSQEHIFPYLVQYNESFYDLLARTTNRWGEFMYYHDGKLNIGYDADESKAVDINGSYHCVTYRDYASTLPAQENAGPYAPEAPYDNNLLKSMVKKDGAAKVTATVKNMLDMDAGADYYWLAKVGQVLTNNKPIMNFLFDTAVNDLLAWAMRDAMVSQYNDTHNDNYFKKKKKYISMLDEQYDDGKQTLNQFSEAKPILTAKDYAGILTGEITAANMTIDIDYDTFAPGLHLGQLIKVDGKLYIVTEIECRQPEVFLPDHNGYYKKGVDTARLLFRVTAIAKGDDTFYPTMIPAGHIRTSGPQVAVVVDADDPNKANRVRVKYPWQLTSLNPVYETIQAADLKGHDVSDATPWLIYAASSGPARAGVHGRHYLAEKVLINYANNNVERPFVVGAVSTATPAAMKTGSAVMQAPNGEYIKVHEGTGKGATAFMANFTPGLSLINGFLDIPDIFGDNEMSKAFEGGVDLGDKYGIWNIKCSTDARSVAINSRWGNVSINAFTGISINAPNGDIRIKGKNVSIEAGNNLTLTSGTNIKNKFISTYGDGAMFNAVSFWYDVETLVAKTLASMVESVFDLALIRSLLEVYWRPQEGALSVQSNRYLKLSAGGTRPGYPDAAYLDPKKKAKKDIDDTGMLENADHVMGKRRLIKKVPIVVDKMTARYQEFYRVCISRRSEMEGAVRSLFWFTSAQDPGELCNGYDALKSKLWDPKTKEITEADLGFTAVCASESPDDVDDETLDRVRRTDAANAMKYSRRSVDALKAYIVKKRLEGKEKVVKQANALLKSIARLRTEPQKLGDVKTAYGISPFMSYVSVDDINAFKAAFAPEKCKGSTFYSFAYDDQNAVGDARTSLTEKALNETDFHKLALIRRVALNLAEGWGMAAQPVSKAIKNGVSEPTNVAVKPAKPVTDADLEDDNKYKLYVESLEFARPVPKSTGLLDAAASAFDPSSLNLATPVREYYSWGNAKAGQILFGAGATYSMKPDGTISKLDTKYNSAPLSKELLNEEELQAFNTLNNGMQWELTNLTINNI